MLLVASLVSRRHMRRGVGPRVQVGAQNRSARVGTQRLVPELMPQSAQQGCSSELPSSGPADLRLTWVRQIAPEICAMCVPLACSAPIWSRLWFGRLKTGCLADPVGINCGGLNWGELHWACLRAKTPKLRAPSASPRSTVR